MRKFRLIGLVVALAVLVLVSKSFAADKIGYVELKRVLDNYGKTKKYVAELESKKSVFESGREKKVAEIKKMQEGMALLQDKDKEKKQVEMEAKMRELRDYDETKQADLQRDTDSRMKDILKDIDSTMQKFAKDNGYTLVFDERFIVYIDKQYDITDKLLEYLNKSN